MSLYKLRYLSEYFRNYVSFFLMFFLMTNLFDAKADENKYLIRIKHEEVKLKEFNSHNAITYSNHDKIESQLKMFFGFDPEYPETSFYPELLIIEDSDSLRDMYKLQLNEMSIKK